MCAGKALLNGAFAAPMVAYSATATRLTFDTTTFEGVTASGEAQGQSDRFLIPVNARARRVTGINQIAGGLLNNVRMNGDLAVADGRLLSDNMKIRSDRINATALIVGDIDKGFYTGALNGKVDGFQVDSVGLFNVVADVDLETTLGRGYALVGTVKARSTRLFSPGFQNFLGGQMFVNAGIRYGTNGILQITRANVVAPQFRLNSGTGTYVTEGGRVVFNGKGYSNQYGPVGVAMTGTFDRPVVRVTASRPGFGVGLSNIVGLVTRSRRGYAIKLTGATDYGPISGDIDVLSGNWPAHHRHIARRLCRDRGRRTDKASCSRTFCRNADRRGFRASMEPSHYRRRANISAPWSMRSQPMQRLPVRAETGHRPRHYQRRYHPLRQPANRRRCAGRKCAL